VQSTTSAVDRAPLLDDVVVYNLDEDSKYLYDMTMNQSENDTIPIEFGTEELRYISRESEIGR
jgi:hypothetical protein